MKKKVADKFARYTFAIGIVVVLLHVSPHIILGQDSYVTIHDNLDSALTYYTVLVQNQQVLKSHSFIEQIMNGIPRQWFPTGLNITVWLFVLFKPFTAYVLNTLFVRLIAFTGIYLLLKTHFLNTKEDAPIVWGSALCFALLPFFSVAGLTVAGQPLLLYAFLNLRHKKQKIADFLIIFIFPFYSFLHLSGVFILFGLGVLFLYDCFKDKRINMGFLLGLFILAISYVAVEYNLIYSTFLNKGIISHRTKWDLAYRSYGFKEAFIVSLVNFIFGQYHAASLHTFILIISLSTGGYLCIKKIAFKEKSVRLLSGLLAITFIISLFYGFFKWSGLIPLKEKFSILGTFHFDRFHWLHPLLWYLIFALVLSILRRIKYGKHVVVFLILCQLFYSLIFHDYCSEKFQIFHSQVMANETRINVKIIANKIVGRQINDISYKQFFSEDVFKEIEEFINLPKKDYRIVSIGIHPSITQYNGFYTLDSYQNIYPLEYKHKFRRIIENELDKSNKWKERFDNWGSRCYVFVAELENEGFLITKDDETKIRNLELNTNALKSMGGKYIFSAVEILNAKDNGLILSKIFERNDSPWKIYLYAVE